MTIFNIPITVPMIISFILFINGVVFGFCYFLRKEDNLIFVIMLFVGVFGFFSLIGFSVISENAKNEKIESQKNIGVEIIKTPLGIEDFEEKEEEDDEVILPRGYMDSNGGINYGQPYHGDGIPIW